MKASGNSRTLIVVGVVVVAAASIWVATALARSSAKPTTGMPAGMVMPAATHTALSPAAESVLIKQLALARAATAKYSNNLPLAKAAGYGIITQMIPTMGYHFLNPKVTGAFNVTRPPILVYEHTGTTWQLGALEWVFTAKPATAPLPGATYGSFPAACHYKDGTFVPEAAQASCPATSPQTGAAFNFWHPNLITMHVWLWYPNPSGLYSSMNPYVAAYNNG